VRKNLSISEAAARGDGELRSASFGASPANVHQQLRQSSFSPPSSGGGPQRPASAPPRRFREHEFRGGAAELEDSAAESIADSAADSAVDSTVDSTVDSSTAGAELTPPVRLASDGDMSSVMSDSGSECSSFDTPYATASAPQGTTQGAAAAAAVMREAMVCRICERRIARNNLKTHSRLCALAEGCNDKLRGNRTVGDRLESLIAAVQRETEHRDSGSGPRQKSQQSQQGDNDAASEGSKRSSLDSLVEECPMAAELLECITQANECVHKHTICEEYVASRDMMTPSHRTNICVGRFRFVVALLFSHPRSALAPRVTVLIKHGTHVACLRARERTKTKPHGENLACEPRFSSFP